jgi:tRNA pseudouridine38-40 synthase
MYRYKIILEYIGLGYCGWQRQKDLLSFQQIIEDAIFSFSKEKVGLSVAGRTDAGVNAYGQVAHFDLQKHYDPKKLIRSINHFSRPHTIGVIQAEEVSDIFHARFSAKSRHYVYKILNRPYISIIEKDLKLWVRHDLDIEKMQEAANFLLGKHDFSSFRASECQANSPIRTLDRLKIIRNGHDIEIQVSALSFLHHMVRNIVGSLIMVGSGKWQPIKIKHILESKDRRFAGTTAPAHGLYFLKVEY